MNDRRGGHIGDWFRQWHLPLRRFLVRRQGGSSPDIDDIAQEVFLRLLRHNRSDLIDCPQAYLYKIAANLSTEWAMRSSRRLPHDSKWLEDLADTLCPAAELERDTLDEELERAVGALPPRSREIIRLYFTEGLCHEDIAKRIGATRRIVKRDMARAYVTLRAALDSDLLRESNDREISGGAS